MSNCRQFFTHLLSHRMIVVQMTVPFPVPLSQTLKCHRIAKNLKPSTKTVASPIFRELKHKKRGKKKKNDPKSGEDIRDVNDDYLFSEAAHQEEEEKKKKK